MVYFVNYEIATLLIFYHNTARLVTRKIFAAPSALLIVKRLYQTVVLVRQVVVFIDLVVI